MAKRARTDGPPVEDRESAKQPDPTDSLGLPRRRLRDGTPNIEFHRERYARLTKVVEKYTFDGEKCPIDIKQVSELFMAEAKLDGFTDREVSDRRTDAEIYRDEAMRLAEVPESIWEAQDETIDHLEAEMEKVVARCKKVIETSNQGGNPNEVVAMLNAAAPIAAQELLERGKGWLSRIRRVRRLREWARNPVPRIAENLRETERFAWEASHVLRYMLYVGRANNRMKKGSSDAVANLFVFGEMHCKMAVTCWEAKNGVEYDGDGVHKNRVSWNGAIIIAPPGHGKSEFAMNFAAQWIALDPQTQAAYLHNAEEMAEESMRYIRMSFDPNTDRGRRSLALYPSVRLSAKGNNASQMQVNVKSKTKSPTMIASGVMSDRQGSNTNLQIRDDIVPQKDIYEATTRDRRKKILHGTWDRRQRGDSTFTLTIATLWHHDDAVCEMVRQAYRKEGKYLVCKIACGGPKSPEPFKAAWPEVYDSEYLRGVYAQLGDARLWAASYMGDPRSEETSIVAKVRCYDSTSIEHRDFMERAITHVSIDPAATNREKNDKAAILYAAVGDVKTELNGSVSFVTKLRVLDAHEIHNTAAQLIETLKRYCDQHRTDYMHIEAVNGFIALKEWIDERFGIDCIAHNPQNKSKEIRLRKCAGLICERICKVGGFEPVVEFPGAPRLNKQGEKVLNAKGEPFIDILPEYQWLSDQLTMFGVHPDDHALDALTQLTNYLSGTGALPASGGMVTEKVREAIERESGDALRIRGDLKQFLKKREDNENDIVDFWKREEMSWN